MERRGVAAGAAARESVAQDAGGLLESRILPQRPFPPMKKYMCLICGWIYDEAAGAPDEGIPPGTRWEDVPPNWTCPECGARKEDFELAEF
jgi:rubredoxin